MADSAPDSIGGAQIALGFSGQS